MQKQPPPAAAAVSWVCSPQVGGEPTWWQCPQKVSPHPCCPEPPPPQKMVLFTHKSTCDCQAVILRVLISRVDLGKRAHGNLTYCGGGWVGVVGGGGVSDISRSFLVSCLSHRDRFPSVVCQQRSHSNRFTFCPPSLKQWRSQQRRSVHSPTVCRAWVSSNVTRSKLGQRSAFAIYF